MNVALFNFSLSFALCSSQVNKTKKALIVPNHFLHGTYVHKYEFLQNLLIKTNFIASYFTV